MSHGPTTRHAALDRLAGFLILTRLGVWVRLDWGLSQLLSAGLWNADCKSNLEVPVRLLAGCKWIIFHSNLKDPYFGGAEWAGGLRNHKPPRPGVFFAHKRNF